MHETASPECYLITDAAVAIAATAQWIFLAREQFLEL
jgi:hypothetical protein